MCPVAPDCAHSPLREELGSRPRLPGAAPTSLLLDLGCAHVGRGGWNHCFASDHTGSAWRTMARAADVLLLLAPLASLPFSRALDNGLGLTPPLGWRSYNAFGGTPTQAIMEAMMDAMVDRSRSVGGAETDAASSPLLKSPSRLSASLPSQSDTAQHILYEESLMAYTAAASEWL